MQNMWRGYRFLYIPKESLMSYKTNSETENLWCLSLHNIQLKIHSKFGLPSLVVFWALQMIRDPRLWVIGTTGEEDDDDNDDEEEREMVVVFNPLHVGKLSFSLEENGKKWACNIHALALAEIVLIWTMPSIAIFLLLLSLYVVSGKEMGMVCNTYYAFSPALPLIGYNRIGLWGAQVPTSCGRHLLCNTPTNTVPFLVLLPCEEIRNEGPAELDSNGINL